MRSKALTLALRQWAVSREMCSPQAQSMTSISRPAAAKEDMSTDNQEDSSGDKGALKESREIAKEAENVKQPNDYTPQDAEEKGDPVRFEPEVADRTRGSGFPHQTSEERRKGLASSTQGEAPVKTREYTPTSDDKKVYPEDDGK